ncbi:MAG: glycosyltransferase family 39 protein [Caldilineaceae bacterium]
MTDPPAAESAAAGWDRRYAGLILAAITLVGFALRLPLLMRFPLREDEAIYGYWALHAWYVDPLFLHVWPDKPPIFLWLLAAALQLWGHGPETAGAAARWVNIMAGTLTIPVLAACARRWWGLGAALATGLLAALSPFAITFAPTAFTDPVLVLAGGLALALAVRRRWFWSGFWLGVAVMTKQQGLLFVPLVAACGLYARPKAAGSVRWVLGLAVVVLPILYWDSLRWTVAPSPWDLGATNVGGVALVAPSAWVARAEGWLGLAWYLLASPWAWGAYVVLLVLAAVGAWRRSEEREYWLPALILAIWGVGFLLLHVGSSVQMWDRYLLPLTVPLALLGGWGMMKVDSWVMNRSGTRSGEEAGESDASVGDACAPRLPDLVPLLAILLLLAVPGVTAAQGGLPIGGDHGAYAGLNEALAAVDRPGALLFHRELGWQARFALFDAIRSGEVELRYYPSTVYLADSATKSPQKERFVIVPDWAPLPDLGMQLAVRGLRGEVVLRRGHFTVYRIEEVPAGDTSWRVCSLAAACMDR